MNHLPASILNRLLPAVLLFLGFTAYGVAQHSATDAHSGATPAPAEQQADASQLTRSERIAETVAYLSSDECGGRRVGTPGCQLAAAWIEEQLKSIGAVPPEGSRGYKQGFSVTRGITIAGDPHVSLYDGEIDPSNYAVASFSGSGSCVDVPIVFAGYGIVAPELEWDDYAGISAEGKAVVIIRGEPQLSNPDSVFGGDQPTVYSDLRRKATTARDMGASALIVINNPVSNPEDELPELAPTYSAASFNIPVIFMRREMLVNTLIGVTGLSWHEIVETMDLEYNPMSCEMADHGLSIDLAVEKDLVTGFNIVGVIPGIDPELSKEYVVVGAHYDHLGIGGQESNAPDRYGEIHPGADDNSSGVAAVLELARWAAGENCQLRRSLLVCLFSGEEVGLIGSGALMRNPPVPDEQIYCMFNYDMVGRLRDDKLYLGGGGTAVEFDSLIGGLPEIYNLKIAQDRSGLGGSDHLSFMQQGHPVLFFFTGPHQQYHTPDDTADLVDIAGVERVIDFSAAILDRAINMEGSLTFNRPEGSAGERPERKQNLRVSMGTVPSFEDSEEPGYVLGDVVPGGPAEQAGMQGGDRIIKIRDRRISDIYDFMFALEDVNPGDTVSVIAVREGEEIEFQVVLQVRNVQR